jgi:DNA-binding transcriptional regulator YhcF (GntR family)
MTAIQRDANPGPRALLEGKAERLLTHCIYRIATGRWAGGSRLPPVREAEADWGLDRRTVMKAYRRLQELGLVEARTRSGYYVSEGPAVGRLSRHRHALEALFERCVELVSGQTDLSLQGVFGYFAELAAIRAQQRPECAFIECTSTQARGHAREVSARLGVPCLGMTLQEIDGRPERVPAWLGTLFVSRFHLGELQALQGKDAFRVQPVSIEVAPLMAEGAGDMREAVLIESDPVEAEHMREDVLALGLEVPLQAHVVDPESLAGAVEELANDDARLVLLSPRMWGRLPALARARPNVREVRFQVAEQAWPTVADALGMPLGDVGAPSD